jgi:sec-independent protein translocase protein TatB
VFADLSVEKLLVLALIGLFVLGPERLPAAVTWLSRTTRRVRDFADDAGRSLQRELGPEVDQLRAPLRELREPLQHLHNLRRPGGSLGRYLTTPASSVFAEPGARSPMAGPDPTDLGEESQAPGSHRTRVDDLAPIDPDAT